AASSLPGGVDCPGRVELHLAVHRVFGRDGKPESTVEVGRAVAPGNLEPQGATRRHRFADELPDEAGPDPRSAVGGQDGDVDQPDVIARSRNEQAADRALVEEDDGVIGPRIRCVIPAPLRPELHSQEGAFLGGHPPPGGQLLFSCARVELEQKWEIAGGDGSQAHAGGAGSGHGRPYRIMSPRDCPAAGAMARLRCPYCVRLRRTAPDRDVDVSHRTKVILTVAARWSVLS